MTISQGQAAARRRWGASQILKVLKKDWQAAAVRWSEESSHKRSLIDDKTHLRWLAPFLKSTYLEDKTTDLIETIALKKESTGVIKLKIIRLG